MNAKCYRTVFNAVRGMLIAVEESAASTGKGRNAGVQAGGAVGGAAASVARFTVLPLVFGTWCALGVPAAVHAQVVAAPGSAAQVVQTQNGLQQVNVGRPNGAGVSINTYTQFNVPSAGTILNNSPTVTQTQQAGYVNGNPNLLPGGSARIIVNQVTSTNVSTLNGYLEVAGPRTEVVISNPNGILVNGGGFINTSRATLTTGVPVFGGAGSLDAFRVTGGQISIQGAGFNVANVDQVDLIARAVQANTAVYANQLNVVAGANQVDHATLAATPIAGAGAAPALGIDVSQLGGMYANKILLASTENGVGVSLKGVTAAQAGDLTLTSQGKLILAGQTNASGNLSVSSAGGIDNTGTTYGQQSVSVNTSDLTNSGTLAAQQGLSVNAGNVASTGTLGAGINNDGSIGHSGDLSVVASGALSATGQNAAGGNATMQGASVNLAGSRTTANGNLNLVTNAGNLDLTGATISAGAALNATAQGALVNDSGHLSSQGATTLTAGSLSNQGGQIVSQSTLSANVAGTVANQGGVVQAAGALTAGAGSLDNTAGHIASLNADGLNVTTTGLLNNGASGAIGGNGNVAVQAGQLSNAGNISAVRNLGVNASQALTNTGTLAANGNVSVAGGSVNNSGGAIAAGSATTVQSGSTFTNAAGLVQGNSSVAVTAAGAITNTGGQIEADGASATLQVSGASLDNTNGRIANVGTGATTINAASIANASPSGAAGAGTIGGNGDVTVTGQTLSNTQGAQIVAGHDLALNVSQSVNNTDGMLSGANNLTMNQSGAALTNQNGSIHGNGAITLNVASLDNTAGKIGNDTGSGGSIAITSGTLSNQGGAVGSDRNLSVTTNQLSGDGKIIAGNDGTVTVNGDYTNTAANQIQGNHNLTLTTTGNFTNQGTLTAVNALNVNAANVDNQAGADLNSASTTVHASNAITNAGRLEGDTVTTQSATLANTGTVVGNVVTLNAGSISNTGASAAIAAATQLNLYASNSLSNTGGAEIYSVGDINIAADGTRDANGLLANRTGVVNNDQSTIAAEGNLEVAAQTLNNTRPAPTVQTVTTDVSSVHETKRSRYIACATMNADPNGGCSQAIWTNEYKNPTTSTYASSQIVSQTSGANPVDNVIVVNVNGQNQTIYYNGVTNNGDGTVNVTYWAGYDPHTNYVPSSEYTTRSDAHNGYQRVEIARDTTTTTQQDQVTSSAPQARLLAGRNMILANVGTINNSYSAIAAGGSIQIGSSSQSGSVGSGSYGGTTVNNTGQTLYQHQNQNIVSTYAWNENPSQDVGTVVQAPVVLSPVAIGGTGGTIVANNAVSINATSVNNTNVAAANSATGATGGTLGAGGAHQPTVNAPQSVAGGNGALSITLPTSGLYSLHPAPGQPYLIVSDPRLTSYTKFISSDYMLGQLGLNPAAVQKRLGDGFYEEKLVRDQVTQLTGRVYLQGYNNNEDEYRALMASGVNAAKQFSLVPGIALTPAQMDALTSDIVWLVSQTVTLPDGSKQQVLAPVVYLAHTHANDLQPTGALIAADNVEIHAVGSAVNSGVIKGGTQTVVTATDIVNRAGSIGSDKTNGTTLVQATHDIVNASGEITGNRVAVLAGHDLINTTLVDANGARAASGDSKVSTSLLGRQGTIASTGDMLVQAGNDLTVHGANISAGGNAQITAGHDILVDTVQSATSQSVTKNDQHHWEAENTIHQTSAISAGGNLAMQSGNDATFKGAQVSAGQDLSVVAGGNLTATTVTNSAKYDNVAADSKTRQEADHTYDEMAVGSAFSAGRNATLAAVNTAAGGSNRTDGKGNVTLTGSSVTSGTNAATPGAVTIAGNGNVTINEGREEHDDAQAVTSKRGSIVSGSTTSTVQSTQSNIGVASTVSGDSVVIRSGKDLTIQGSNVVGTNDVTLGAAGNVNITASENTQRSQSDYKKREYGFLSGLNLLNQLDGGLQGYVVGTRTTTDTQQATQTTHNGSMVGSVNGNLTITSGSDLHISGSTVHAGNDLALAGKTVKIDAVQDTATQDEQQTFRQTAISAGLSNPVLSAVQTGRQMASAAQRVNGDARLSALAAATTALAAKNLYDLATTSPQQAASIGVNVSIGASKSDSQSHSESSTAVGSTVSAGHNVTIAAAGAGKDSNIDVIGSTISAGNNALLTAEGDVNLQAAQNTSSQHSTNSSMSGGIGVTIGVGSQTGIAFTAGASGSRGHADGDSSTWTNTHVAAGNTLTVQSGGDTNLNGAVASGKQVVADVGGNLNIGSLQDTDHYDSKQQSAGVSVSICVPPICYGASSVSGNVSQNKLNSDYVAVGEQSGIKAGDGGFQVNVKGNTDLKGGVISSSDKAVQDGVNSLTTATLTTSDIQNHANYSGSQVGISGGYGFGGSADKTGVGKDQQGKTDSVNPIPGTEQPSHNGVSVSPPVALSASGDASSTTRSGISNGTITITDEAKQQQLTGKTAAETVASINRDTSNTGGALAPIFDKDKIQAGFEITSQFINQVGTFIDNKTKQIDAANAAAKNPNLTPEQRAQAQQQADQLAADWGPSGNYRQVLTALTVAAGGNVTGGMGQFAQNATVAYLQELGANQVKQLADYLKDDTARAALHAIVGCAGAAASSQSCGAGAMGAAASSVLGTLLGPTDGMSAQEKQARENLVTSLVAGVATVSGTNAATATGAAQIEAENNQLAPRLPTFGVDLVRKYCPAAVTCTDKQVSDLLRAQNALNTAAGKNATVAALLLGGPTLAAAGVALVALAPEMLAVALANPTAAVQAGIITTETAAAILTNSVTPGVALEGAAAKTGGAAARTVSTGATEGASLVKSGADVAGFSKGISASEISSINDKFGGSTAFREVDNILSNAANYDGFYDKSASLIRDIAGGHLFDNGNKRTAVEVVETLIQRNSVDGPPISLIWSVVDRVATGQLRDVRDISLALRGLK